MHCQLIIYSLIFFPVHYMNIVEIQRQNLATLILKCFYVTINMPISWPSNCMIILSRPYLIQGSLFEMSLSVYFLEESTNLPHYYCHYLKSGSWLPFIFSFLTCTLQKQNNA